MAQRIKFRLNAAKVGVSMALAALAGGVVEKLRSEPSDVHLTPASAPGNFIKLGGLPQKIRTDFQKIEQKVIKLEDKWIKLDSALGQLDQKVITQQAKVHFLFTAVSKMKAAEEVLSEDLSKLGSQVDKVLSAGYLTSAAAKNKFIQGRGGVITAATPALVDGSVRQLLKSPDGSLVVSVLVNSDGYLSVRIDNTTGALLPAVQILDNGAPISMDLQPGDKNVIQLGGPGSTHHLQLQTWGDGTSNAAQTLVLSSEPSPSSRNESQVVAQMLIGLL